MKTPKNNLSRRPKKHYSGSIPQVKVQVIVTDNFLFSHSIFLNKKTGKSFQFSTQTSQLLSFSVFELFRKRREKKFLENC